MSHDESVSFEELEGEIELTPPEIYGSNLIEWAIDRHASDLFVSDWENSVVVSVRRLGKVEIIRRLARAYGHRLQGHFRVLAGADAGESIHPTEGRGLLQTPDGGLVDLRLSSIPTLFGQEVAVRLFDPVRGARSIEHLGFDDAELHAVRTLLGHPSGLILATGPVASGKSSSLYAAIEALNDGTRKIHTLEDPIEHSLKGVVQSQVNVRAGLDFAELLSSVMRHSPDVIMIGEIRDVRTAETAICAGASGQLVLATIHSKSAAEAVDAILQYESKPKFLAGALTGVINQRLVRQLCPECRQTEPYTGDVPERIRARLGDQEPRLGHAPGCEACFGDGYVSLTCMPEIMTISRRISDAISNGAAANELEDIAKEEGMLSLGEVAAVRALRADTTPHEAARAVSDPFLATLVSHARFCGE